MLSNLIKMFVLSNMASAGAKQLGIGSGNIIKDAMGFLGVKSSSESGGMGSSLEIPELPDAKNFQTTVTKGPLSAAPLQKTQPSQQFPMGTKKNLQSAMADPRVLRLLENISIDSISNQTISLDDYKSYDVTESRIDIG